MKDPEKQIRPFSTTEEKDRLFEALETDSELFTETFEVMLSLIVSDPVLTYNVADLIESDYRNLYMVIMKKIGREMNNDSSLGCCKEIN